jgi:TP53 regulating kinase-like protein
LDKLVILKQLKKGAEANIILANWYGKKVVLKSRNIKKYRHPQLDEKIRRVRTVHEPQLMHEAKKAGVSTPIIFQVDTKNMLIIMEFINGEQVKHILANLSIPKRQNLCFKIGMLVARLHSHGIIHGDLTTSNLILSDYGKLFFIDFGLAEKQIELEAKGVDLHLMKRSLQSTHNQFSKNCFKSIMNGYSKVIGETITKDVLKKIQEIERRGRYVEERKIK